jgi:protein-L-isoaspartate(D-aspartate) O-methyltransferase
MARHIQSNGGSFIAIRQLRPIAMLARIKPKTARQSARQAGESSSSAAIRDRYARHVMRLAGASDRRLRDAFASVAREAFLPPPPWKILPTRLMFGFSTSNPRHLYRNVLVAIDVSRGINNGEPALHAAWLAAVEPKRGERVCHIGAGGGYYTAIIAELVGQSGRVEAYEIVPELAKMATGNLADRRNVRVYGCDPAAVELGQFDIVYVNAAAVAPPLQWVDALKPGGRLIFPWRPSDDVAVAMLVRRTENGFSAMPLMGAWFIPLAGSGAQSRATEAPSRHAAKQIQSLVRTPDRKPDDSAIAAYNDVWFSSRPPDAIVGSKGIC